MKKWKYKLVLYDYDNCTEKEVEVTMTGYYENETYNRFCFGLHPSVDVLEATLLSEENI